ncbi:cycloheximide resistance protein [Pseudozyma hubeiensis SY62]|uniref:Cycloheximide resistance protein n=1 Tax=Pseudozyma hubeiensis (strain SY62) TaxID=1305764 RepID=R9PDA8_PSEHS|nr:cycloheximide resistance protein [Pseudozyma hubeiensis SY62]GAC96095.1 cycloheximide resistance protein [Pseudozyma hubeiensis SY62]
MHIGDTAFGQIARALSGGKRFAHPESSSKVNMEHQHKKGLGGGHEPQEPGSNVTPAWLSYAMRWSNAESKASLATSQLSETSLSADGTSNAVNVVTWYGDKDPANPQNWSSAEKAYVAGLICLYTFAVYMGSAVYTPSLEGVMREFNVSYAAGNLGLALFVFGYGSGAMLFSPLSEIPAVGRNWIYIITTFLGLLFSIGAALAPNFGSLLVFRFLAGFMGSPALATGGATLQDIYSITKIPHGIALWVAAASMGPALGPVMGGFAAQAKGWRWPLWIEVWLIAPVLLVMIFTLPETSHQNILYRRAKRLRVATGQNSLQSEGEMEQKKLTVSKMVIENLVRPVQISVLDPGTGFMNAYVSLVYAIYYSFFESFPLIYPVIYGFTLGTTGVAFVSVVVTTAIGAACYTYYIYFYVEPKIRGTGELPVLESRLLPAIPASLLMPVGLFLYAWSARESVHWMVSLIGVGIYSIGFYVFLQCVLLYIPLMYPKYSASLLAANDFCRSSLATGFIMAGRPLFKNLGIGGGVSLIAGLTVLCIPALLLLYRHGAYLRSKSNFAGMPDSAKTTHT